MNIAMSTSPLLPRELAFWKGKRTLVTGADGFIGSHLVDALVQCGVPIVAVVRRVSRTQVTHRFSNLRDLSGHDGLSFITVNLAGPSATSLLARSNADVWFHLAADAYVPASFSQPSDVVLNNISSTINVLEAANISRPANLIIMSSSEVYGSCSEPIDEDHPLCPTSPYAASKVACDRMAWSYWQSFGTALTIARPFNTYGPRHVYDVVPLFIAAALQNKPIVIHGTGRQTRDLVYVDDTVYALLSLAASPAVGRVFNIGTGTDTSVLDLATCIIELTESSSQIVFDAPRQGEVQKLQANSSRIRSETGWKPLISLRDGIQRNISWARKVDLHD